MTKRTTALFYLLLVSIIWGAASPVVKHTLQWFDPWLFLTYRFFISTALALPALYITKPTFPKKTSTALLVLLSGLVSAPLSLFLFFEALNKTTALSASLLTAVGPLFMIAGGYIFFRDRILKNEKIGITVALLGTLLTVGFTDSFGKLEGNIIMLLAIIADVIGALLSKEAIKKGVDAGLIAHITFIIGFIIFAPLLLLRLSPIQITQIITNAPLEAHFGVLFMAVLSGTIAYWLRNIAIKSIEISESALYTYLQPLWAAILAVLWLKESITPSYIIGGIIITIGVIIAEQKRK